MNRIFVPALGQQSRAAIALALGLMAFYVMGLDQGWLLSLAQGDIAYAQNLIHEAIHDARHAAGFVCH